ncbi:hypothetical protein JMJ35_001937 [Cladonia borealis]|uniref:Rhodopsin domain-containing protein n=1 Tax=Cladonia borealis TaxID=184061 RepID=A0AA39R9Q5_9LECA|nr:hypothetical protein JMJ35_001937 [Cladonia borealis]
MASSPFDPAIQPPQGWSPNPSDSASLSKWNTMCVCVCLFTTTLVFALRTYVRICIKRQWILEDYMCLLSWIGLVIFCSLMTVTVHKHGGVHEWDISTPEMQEALYWFNTTTVEYAPAMLCTKVAILLLYRRVFSAFRKSAFDLTIRIFIAILVLFYVATFFVKIWLCVPRARIWNKSIPGTCLYTPSVLNTNGIVNVITDTIILLIPTKAVWNLQLDKKRKAGVILVFSVGCLAPIFSIVGTIVRIQVSKSPDVTWYQPMIQMWAAAEISTGLICVCCPTLAALAHHPNPRHKNSPNVATSRCSAQNYVRSSRLNCPMSQDEVDLFDPSDHLRGHGHMKTASVPDSMIGVITGIEGGFQSFEKGLAERGTGDCGSNSSVEDVDNVARGSKTGILTTVRIEQSYV